MPHTTAGGPAIWFETAGTRRDDPVVLVAGAGAQLIWWHDAFVETLVARGEFVVRLDNRDVGLSDKLGGPADLDPVYTTDDMAGDVCRVLDVLGVAAAHIVGQSLGGAVAQAMASSARDRVRSLVLFYTIPGFDLKWATDEYLQVVQIAPSPSSQLPSREEAIAAIVAREQLTRSTAYPFDDARLLDVAQRSWERGDCPGGIMRQMAAAMTSFCDRTEALQAIDVPTAIIHGRADRIIRVEAAFELGRLIPESELHVYAGMGHDIVEALWPEFAATIIRTVTRARAAVGL